MRHTEAGRKGSAKYNNTVRLETLRCAMVGQLRSPPIGFEEVTIRHFAMCRQRIVVQARRWMLEARNTDLFSRYERSYAELLSLLDTDSMRTYESLPPLPEDIEMLKQLEPSFVHLVGDAANGKIHAEEPSNRCGQLEYNPWATGSADMPTRPSVAETGNESGSPDDELYE